MAKQVDRNRLRMRRLELHLSQEALATRSKVSKSKIAHIETGVVKGRDSDTQEALAEALGVTVDYLCGAEPMSAKVTTMTAGVSDSASLAVTDLGAIDRALEEAWHPPTHRVVDLAVVRSLVMQTRRTDLAVRAARSLLDASARLRGRGEPSTPAAVAVEAAGADETAAPHGPSAKRTPSQHRE